MILLRVFILSLNLICLNLSSSLIKNIINLLSSETLKMIWNKSVASVLRCGSLLIFSHEITLSGLFNFKIVLLLLILPPCLFSCSLLVRKILIICLELLQLLTAFYSAMVAGVVSVLIDVSFPPENTRFHKVCTFV